MIINIRGTSGSGKTTLIKHFFTLCESVEEIEQLTKSNRKKIIGYKCVYKGEEIVVLGSYVNACGGCDSISSQDEITDLIESYSLDYHVIFESLFISHIYGRYAEIAKRSPKDFLFIMLETPFDTCMDHIRLRREEAGKPTELKESVYRNARKTYDSTYRIRTKLTNDNLQWEELGLDNRFKLFEDMLDFYLL